MAQLAYNNNHSRTYTQTIHTSDMILDRIHNNFSEVSIDELRIMICGLHIWRKMSQHIHMNWELAFGWPLWNICVTNDHGYVPLVANTTWSFPHSWLITGFVTRLIRRVPLEEQELHTLSGAPEFAPVVCPISFNHCVVCSSAIYGFLLPLWYLQTLL